MQLAQPGDPVVTQKGQVVSPQGRREPMYTRSVPLASNVKPKTTRSLRELGTEAQTQSVINVVLVYQLLGMTDNETAHHLNTTAEEIEQVKELGAYQATWEMIFNEVINTNSSSLQARIQAMAGDAIDNMMDLAREKPVEITATDDAGNEYRTKHFAVPPIVIQKANADILDRAGLTGELLFGQQDDAGGQVLEIEVVSSEDTKTNVKVNIHANRQR